MPLSEKQLQKIRKPLINRKRAHCECNRGQAERGEQAGGGHSDLGDLSPHSTDVRFLQAVVRYSSYFGDSQFS
jgi:hypothetical protein